MKKKNIIKEIPKTFELENELNRVRYLDNYKKVIKNIVSILIIVSATSILIATLIFPVLKIYGNSMNPLLLEGDIALNIKKIKYKTGDVIAFYYNNRILIKRIVGTSFDWVNIIENGDVYINEKLLNEPYIKEKSLGKSEITYPYQVPENNYFVLGDDRVNSIDSRSLDIKTIKEEDIIGKVIFKLWPIKRIGFINN